MLDEAIEPVGQARSDYEIFTGLAEKLGLSERYTEGRTAEEWLQHLWDQTRQRAGEARFSLPTLEELREQETINLPPNPREPVLLEAFVSEPEQNRLSTPSGKIEIFSETIAGFGYDDCPGHPIWMEPQEWLGKAAPDQFHLISNQCSTVSRFDSPLISTSVALLMMPREPTVVRASRP